jgi:hypothetical protein
MSRAVALLLERRLPLSEFGDAVKAGGDHQHLLLLFRIGNYFAKSAQFFSVLKPESHIA